jgi:hypothetical protein
MDLAEIGWGGGGVDSPGSGQGSLVGTCGCGDEPLGSGTRELVRSFVTYLPFFTYKIVFSTYRWCRVNIFRFIKLSEQVYVLILQYSLLFFSLTITL